MALIEVPSGLEPQNLYSLRVAVTNPSFEELNQVEVEGGDLWFVELGEEASPPLKGPRLRLLRDVRVQPTSTAISGRAAPILLTFVPSSTVPASGRLLVTAPCVSFDPESCLVVESGGACEQCSAAAESLEDLAATTARNSVMIIVVHSLCINGRIGVPLSRLGAGVPRHLRARMKPANVPRPTSHFPWH